MKSEKLIVKDDFMRNNIIINIIIIIIIITIIILLFKNYKFAGKSMPLWIPPAHKTLLVIPSTLHPVHF